MQGISVRGVTKRFGQVTALSDVTFDVTPGEAAVLLGPNGAGKSTLLRILGTMLIPDVGDAFISGYSVGTDPAAVRRSIGFLLADERSWYWRISGRHNLEFFAALHGFGRKSASRRANELLAEVGLLEAADRSFAGYSTGMRLRLSLARALLDEPPVLLLDEPTRSLDPVATKQFRDLIERVTAERNAAVLIATHDLHEAAALASYVLVLFGGRLAATSRSWADSSELERMLLEEQK